MTINDGQQPVPMKWIFSIKSDGTYTARPFGRGNLTLLWVDYSLWRYKKKSLWKLKRSYVSWKEILVCLVTVVIGMLKGMST